MAKITEHLVDKRIVQRNIEGGLITQAEYEAHLSALPDGEANMELVTLPEDDDEADEAALSAAPGSPPVEG